MNLTAAQTEASSSAFNETKKSGLFSGGGLSITLGKSQQSSDQQSSQTGAAASTVGAIAGDVNIQAGRNYAQVGSDVLTPGQGASGQAAGGDINIQAQNIAIVEARTSQTQASEHKSSQSGLTLAITVPVVTAVQSTLNTVQATTQTQDTRSQALGAATAALQAKQVFEAVSAIQAAQDPAAAASVGISLSLGASKSQSNGESARQDAQGSNLQASGRVNLIASGAGQGSNILIQGSQVSAGNSVRLVADNQVKLLAAQNTTTESSSHKNASASIGLGLMVGPQGAGLSVNASASQGKGAGAGSSTEQLNTRIEAGQLRLQAEENRPKPCRRSCSAGPAPP